MMKWVFTLLIGGAVVFGLFSGNIGSVSNAALDSCANAVTLILTLCGVICLWSGIMRVAQSAGITELLARLLNPVLSRLFKGINKKGKAMQYIVLNLAANLLGLGNASTPFGVAAMRELEKEEGAEEKASDNMILLVVMNTASLQLIPTTVAAMRLKNGSAQPMEILPCVWLVSAVCIILTVSAAKLMAKAGKGRRS